MVLVGLGQQIGKDKKNKKKKKVLVRMPRVSRSGNDLEERDGDRPRELGDALIRRRVVG